MLSLDIRHKPIFHLRESSNHEKYRFWLFFHILIGEGNTNWSEKLSSIHVALKIELCGDTGKILYKICLRGYDEIWYCCWLTFKDFEGQLWAEITRWFLYHNFANMISFIHLPWFLIILLPPTLYAIAKIKNLSTLMGIYFLSAYTPNVCQEKG